MTVAKLHTAGAAFHIATAVVMRSGPQHPERESHVLTVDAHSLLVFASPAASKEGTFLCHIMTIQ